MRLASGGSGQRNAAVVLEQSVDVANGEVGVVEFGGSFHRDAANGLHPTLLEQIVPWHEFGEIEGSEEVVEIRFEVGKFDGFRAEAFLEEGVDLFEASRGRFDELFVQVGEIHELSVRDIGGTQEHIFDGSDELFDFVQHHGLTSEPGVWGAVPVS